MTGPSGTITAAKPTITGTGQPGATITVKEGDTVLGTTTVGADGKWSLTPEQDLAEGKHTIVAEQDADGQKSTAEGSFEINLIDELLVAGPTPGAVVDTATPTVSGTAEPGATVTVKDKNGTTLGTATADENGNWSTGIGTLPDGNHQIVVTDTHGGSKTVDFVVDAEADFAELVVTSPAPENGATPTVDSKTPTVSGTGEPGAEITITDQDGTELGKTVVDENGDWAITLPELGEGEQKITVTDNHGGSTEVEFVVTLEGGDTPMLAGSLAGVMLAGAAGVGLLIRRRQQAKAAA
ncbi:Ig-like domain-containing protein [Leucobacter iarius]|uniref:Ig-like domain-containing protein n=1 Tax=Leucobacter iarius TaxID=333963 RepID=UPI0031D7E074